MEAPISNFWDAVKSNLTAKNSENKLLQTWFEPTQLLGFEDSDHGRKFQLGVPTELHVYPGAIHAFEMVPGTGLAEQAAMDLRRGIGRLLR